ncbi:hypothetical protein STEG23_017726, partial [Scotinomys teguina]
KTSTRSSLSCRTSLYSVCYESGNWYPGMKSQLPLLPSGRQGLLGMLYSVLCDDSVHPNLPFGNCCENFFCTVNHDSIWPSFG